MAGRLRARDFGARYLAVMLLIILLPAVVGAAEIYGRVSQGGRILSGADVSMTCPSFSEARRVKTDRTGVYRIAGPPGEEECTIQVNGSNSVKVFTASTGSTRVNLEIVKSTLIRR